MTAQCSLPGPACAAAAGITRLPCLCVVRASASAGGPLSAAQLPVGPAPLPDSGVLRWLWPLDSLSRKFQRLFKGTLTFSSGWLGKVDETPGETRVLPNELVRRYLAGVLRVLAAALGSPRNSLQGTRSLVAGQDDKGRLPCWEGWKQLLCVC